MVVDFMAILSSPSSIALGIYEQHVLTIGLILVQCAGKITSITTFEALNWNVAEPGPNGEIAIALQNALTDQFAPPSMLLLCNSSVFEGLLEAPEKRHFLSEAQSRGQAIFWDKFAP